MTLLQHMLELSREVWVSHYSGEHTTMIPVGKSSISNFAYWEYLFPDDGGERTKGMIFNREEYEREAHTENVLFVGSPPTRPLALAAANPAFIRSRIRSRSNSASAPVQ